MADLFQGNQLPSSTTTTQTQETLPEYFNTYLQNIANVGENAVRQGGVAGPSGLQQQAYSMAPDVAFSGASTLGNAAGLTTAAGSTFAPDIVNRYMNPYTRNVVDEMARLSNQNLQRNVMPMLKGYGASTGGFGSSRMANATGQTLADIQANLTGKQYEALESGYEKSINNAQDDLNRMMQSGQTLSNIGMNQSNVGTTGLKTLADLGKEQRDLEQARLDYPMIQAKKYSELLQPYAGVMPRGKVEQTTKPGETGQFANSPLSQITGLLAAMGSLYRGMNSGANTGSGSNAGTNNNDDSNLINMLINGAQNIDWSSIFNFAEGGSVNNASVRGGLQSIIQNDNNSSTNTNVPMTYSSNPNVPNISQTLPQMSPPSLSYAVDAPDYREVG